MRRSFLTLFALALFLAPAAHAGLPLNPLDWFTSDKDEPATAETIELANTREEEAAAKLVKARKAYDAGKFRSANRQLKKITKEYPTASATGEAYYLRGQIFISKKRWAKGFDSLQEIIAKHPSYPNFDRVTGQQFECASELMDGARGRIFWIFPGFKQYGESIKEFEQIVRNAPYSDYAPLSLMNIALLSETRGEAEDAIDALDRLINYYPQSMLASDAYYNLARTYANLVQSHEYDQGSTRQAISYYEDFLILFPSSEYIAQVEAALEAMENLLASSRLDLGDFYYYYRANNTAALVFYNETITIAPDSEAAATAEIRISDIDRGIKPVTKSSILRKLLLAD